MRRAIVIAFAVLCIVTGAAAGTRLRPLLRATSTSGNERQSQPMLSPTNAPKGTNPNRRQHTNPNDMETHRLPEVRYFDPQASAKADPSRQAKNDRYSGQATCVRRPMDPSTKGRFGAVIDAHWERTASSLPVAESDFVLLGDVVSAKAFLSSDKTLVYCEFEVAVKEVFKGNISRYSTADDLIRLTRLGGDVVFSDD